MSSEPTSRGAGRPAGRGRAPKGRAAGLVAMPSALLLTLGLSSPLAQAEQHPENPFQDRPCVEVPDETVPETEQEETTEEPAPETESDAPDTSEDTDEPDTDQPDDAEEVPETDEDADDGTDDAPADDGTESGQDTEASGDGESAETEDADDGRHPLDPLGLEEIARDLGDGLRDVLTPGGLEDDEAQTDSDGTAEEESPAEEPDEPVDEDVPAEEEPPGEEDEKRNGEDEETAEEPRVAENEGTGDVPDTDPAEEPNVADDPFAPDEDGRVPYPCPEQQQVPGEDEQLAEVIPNEPWYLDATYLTLTGLSYHGVVNITTADGTSKQALKFTADTLDIGDLHQIVPSAGGVRHHVQAAAGSNSEFRDGEVTMYTERLEGNLFGLIPVEFDPEHEPPLDIPVAHFTDVLVTQAAQFGGTLTMPGMQQYMTFE